MDSSDSDEDDCQLYTKTGEHFIKLRDEMQAKQRELQKKGITNFLIEDDIEKALNVDNEKHKNLTQFEDAKYGDESLIIVEDNSELEDDMPLAELSRNLRSKKRRNKSSPVVQQKRPKRNSRRRNKKQPPPSQVRNLGVVVLDDDTGYPVDQLPPIDFNRRSRKIIKISDEELENISLESIINQDSEGNLIENDDLVTLTIEWNNGHKTSRKEFKLRRYQKFESVFEELAKMENISTNRVLLMYDFKSVNPMDTPSSLKLSFYGALIGSVSATEINHNKVNIDDESDTGSENNSGLSGSIQVKLLLQSKKTLLFKVLKNQKMDILYKKCAEELKCETNKLKLTFDGDYVEPSEIVSDLDIEDGDVFHVHVKMS